MRRDLAVGIDVGGYKILGILASKNGTILKEREVQFLKPLKSRRDFLGMLFPLVDFLLIRVKPRVKGIGLGVPSVVWKNKPILYRNLQFLNGFDLAAVLRARYRLSVVLDNDAKVAALGEARFGAGRGVHYLLMLTLGTGIGCGVALNRKRFEGAFDSAYEIGRMIVEKDKALRARSRWYREFEDVASAKFFLRQGLDPIEERRKALKGNRASKNRWKEFGKNLGVGLANIVNLMEPERIVIAGGLQEAWQLFAPEAVRTMRRFTFSPIARREVKVVRTKLGRNAGALGAALLPFT